MIVVGQVEMVDCEHIVELDACQLVVAEVDISELIFLVSAVDASQVDSREVVAGEVEVTQATVPAQVDIRDMAIGQLQVGERMRSREVDAFHFATI